MSKAKFHVYVFASARVGLYRTLLSIWKMDSKPNLVSIFHPIGKREIIEKSIFTVSEDTSDSGPAVRLIENRDSLKASILNDVPNVSFDATGFLVERDMLMPSYAEIMCRDFVRDQNLALAYYQRRKFGNSKLVSPKLGARIPISSLVLDSSQILSFFSHAELLDRNEFFYTKEFDFSSEDRIGRVIVQSNIHSPYDL